MGVKPGSAKPALVCSRGLTSKVKSSYCMVEIILVQRQEKKQAQTYGIGLRDLWNITITYVDKV